ncbi:MAG TPA: Do family serine endopeptidase [Stellaceae bacterium]|nr:Do family serine endopeptidase [Stellaceae bacterium]
MKRLFPALVLIGGIAVMAALALHPLRAAEPIPESTGGAVPSLAPMLKNVTPGVVNIAVKGRQKIENPLLQDPFFRRFFNIPQGQQNYAETQATGSGVIVDAAQGYVLTNAHVVANETSITITTKENRKFAAKLVGRDPETDVAVIKIDSDHLTAVPLGDSDKLEVGDFVVAIGNPFGLGQTVTSGIVSALGRSGLGIEGYEDFIQTDASINPGNSGGALVDLRGNLVGINTAILAPGGGNIGIGFAVPINMARKAMDQLVRYGEVKRGIIGVSIQDLTPDLAQAMNTKQINGAVIAKVLSGSPADRAGLKTGDLVVAANGVTIHSGTQLRDAIGLTRVGEDVDLTIDRNGNERNVAVKVEAGQQANQPALER